MAVLNGFGRHLVHQAEKDYSAEYAAVNAMTPLKKEDIFEALMKDIHWVEGRESGPGTTSDEKGSKVQETNNLIVNKPNNFDGTAATGPLM